MREVAVIGVGMTRFGRYEEKSILDHGREACRGALKDANIEWREVQIAYCGATQQGITPGTRVLAELALTGIPVITVDNASASGASAFREAYMAVATERVDVALAFGVGKMGRMLPSEVSSDPAEQKLMKANVGILPVTFFAMRMKRRMNDYGNTIDQFARIAVKNRRHGSLNPFAQFQRPITLEDVHNSRMICDPLTVLHCCATGDGGAAAILCSMDKAAKHVSKPLITVAASASSTQPYRSRNFPGPDKATLAAHDVYQQSGCGPWDMDLVQVHDAFTVEEIDFYELLGFCEEGEGGRLIDEGVTEIGGRVPFSTDGGLLARGHPMGPTGLAQIWETVIQLRGEAGPRQVEGARVGMCHIIGFGDVSFAHVLKR